MHYEINVSHNGVHLFATHGRSIPDLASARTVYKVIKDRFPESEGFKVSLRTFIYSECKRL